MTKPRGIDEIVVRAPRDDFSFMNDFSNYAGRGDPSNLEVLRSISNNKQFLERMHEVDQSLAEDIKSIPVEINKPKIEELEKLNPEVRYEGQTVDEVLKGIYKVASETSRTIADTPLLGLAYQKTVAGSNPFAFFTAKQMAPGFMADFGFQEGGEVKENITQPNLTSSVLPTETVQPTGFVDNISNANTVDTTQGFYSVNPAPGESGANFEQRTMQYTQPVDVPKVKTSSFRPPEGYVSPRVSDSFENLFGFGKKATLDYTDTSNLTSDSNAINLPTDSGLSESELATLTTLGTLSDVMVGEGAKAETYLYQDRGISKTVSDTFTNNRNIYPESNTLDANLDIYYGGVADYVERGVPRTVAEEIMSDPKKYPPHNTLDANLDIYYGAENSAFDNIKEAIAKLGDKHLFTLQDGTYNVTLRDLYDEFTAALLVGVATGDAGKAAIAGGTQFIKTEVIESYALKAGEAASKAIINAGGGQTAADAAAEATATRWRGFGGAAASIAGVLALGGDEEAALTAGVQHLITEYGAEQLGSFLGVEKLPGFETAADAQGAVGAAAIAAVVSFLRPGDVEQAAISGATSYMFSVNPILGIAAMALQFLTASKPSYKSGYASFDFDEFKMNTYSQGDYDPSKANPSNVEFSKKLLSPMIPYMQELEKTTGFNFKGDLQIHYSQGKKGAGVYYTIGNVDQEGLSAREMLLNRPDYYNGKDQSTQDGGRVYRRFFQPTKEGLEAMYESLYADLAYIAENKITDLTHYTGVVKSAEEIQADTQKFGFDMSNFTFMQDGGKILDKTSKVLYNSNQTKNYGLVDKEGKAPPSARADDVPMTLKEGDFVLSQPAVALYGEDTINRMVQRAANEAGTNLKSGGKVPVNVHNGEYIIPKKLTEYIGSNVLETMNNRGLMSVGERPNT